MRYITTPIYYVNDVAHIGHAYTTIIADVFARFYRLKGHKTYFLTGTDEHGQKIEQSAKLRQFTPREYADEISAKFKNLWDEFEISYDQFIRTTDENHKLSVQKAFKKMFDKGDIYKGTYEGFYCMSCESYFTQTQLINECNCPDCGKKTELLKEESYFFRLSKYQDKILRWYKEQEPIMPKNKANELINFVENGLKDLSITRTSFEWGIKLPKELNDEKHVIYVWLDALMNYVSALGYGLNEEKMDFWPAHIHFVGKDILRFHAIYWPAFLMSLELPLPKFIAAHGWWTKDGEKMSKSKGNVVSPKEVAETFGLESFRYFLLREIPFGNDGDFSDKALITRINAELSNELGNLLNRIIGMSAKYSNNIIKSENVMEFFTEEIQECKVYIENAIEALESIQPNKFLEELFKALSLANSSVSKYEPWNLIKNQEVKKANALVALCANILAKVTILLSVVMPKTSNKIAQAMNFSISTSDYQELIKQDKIIDFQTKTCEVLFPKIELKQEIDRKENEKISSLTQIKIDDFKKIEIKVALVKACEKVEGSDKLLKFQLELENGEIRQVLSGIAKFYKTEELIGKQVCVITNLKKAKIFGYESQGMILSAQKDEKLVLITPQNFIANGALIG
ncbi:methionine--tRNA ligase [Campylobacter insulaenigrae]|uniref:methionine--tRNA ligase n=1 Tax=Campylobacter insulaenigrae TaxID=260714 RepID=UPI002152684D|nr:methionine--tRNA ligase [Campylobacter insulaenigrae]MCR6573174.1 methionine--tRNA ligase [Campylobacter insulaenigrae]MCR6574961.1 methionine--tRNA ligase [Campylobacter insulaenigrae]MCR6576357.1 methionine--tRNA ligase [Campylobacter insulaenigrae]MCR6578900.1 methionine--tRNA ligase [Campylobacter insulaenigrae]MCR6579938.1 methionine--tRNA ligase [Campylobacter insulaenigrae]